MYKLFMFAWCSIFVRCSIFVDLQPSYSVVSGLANEQVLVLRWSFAGTLMPQELGLYLELPLGSVRRPLLEPRNVVIPLGGVGSRFQTEGRSAYMLSRY